MDSHHMAAVYGHFRICQSCPAILSNWQIQKWLNKAAIWHGVNMLLIYELKLPFFINHFKNDFKIINYNLHDLEVFTLHPSKSKHFFCFSYLHNKMKSGHNIYKKSQNWLLVWHSLIDVITLLDCTVQNSWICSANYWQIKIVPIPT